MHGQQEVAKAYLDDMVKGDKINHYDDDDYYYGYHD